MTMSINALRTKFNRVCKMACRSWQPLVSTAPFIGLFGRAWGIYNALTAIGMTGNASIDKVAEFAGEALIMTAFVCWSLFLLFWVTTGWFVVTKPQWKMYARSAPTFTRY